MFLLMKFSFTFNCMLSVCYCKAPGEISRDINCTMMLDGVVALAHHTCMGDEFLE